MLLVKPEKQGRGLGTLMITAVQQQARQAGLPVRLSVLRVNPALEFYLTKNFAAIGEDKNTVKLEWRIP
jgi:GNAT superfamily N-acetyltransferase